MRNQKSENMVFADKVFPVTNGKLYVLMASRTQNNEKIYIRLRYYFIFLFDFLCKCAEKIYVVI